MTTKVLEGKKTDEISPRQENLLKFFEDEKRRIKNSGIGFLIGTIYVMIKNNYSLKKRY